MSVNEMAKPQPKADELQLFYDYLMKPDVIQRNVDLLAQYCAIKSVSGDETLRSQCFDMVNRAHSDLHTILDIPLANMKISKNPEDPSLPPILTAHMGQDENKATLLVYGHLDVQPADPEHWTFQEDPFKLTKVPSEGGTFETNRYYARGTTDDKGPVLGWINALKAYKDLNMDIPVNIKFLFECMEESGGLGLEAFIENEAKFFEGVDAVCISDNYWLGLTKPCVTYGLRGVAYYNVTIKCADGDLHSGVFGGTVREALIDMINVFSKLTDGKGNIIIDGVNDDVLEMTDEEKATYGPIDFNPEEYRQQIGTAELLYPDKFGTLTHRWRYPSLSIHGFVGASDGNEDQTVIPKEVTGKFSIRLVPNQDADDIDAKVDAYVHKIHAASGSKNPLQCKSTASSPAWLSSYTDANYQAGINAQFRVFGEQPDLTREGGSIPVTLLLQNATNSSVMLLPIGQSDDGAHSQNEKMSEKNYINGAKVLGTYLNELGKAQNTLKSKKKPSKK